jgi:endonuclease/exonuclease/phosphatase family metal-dependent hydrolase
MKQVFAALATSVFLSWCGGLNAFAAELREITVLSYNIHHGEGLDGKIDLERIAQIITKNKADLVALQEVDKLTKRSGGIDQAKELARLTRLHQVFGKAIDHQGGEYGQAILSRWPISHHLVRNLPQKPGREQRIALFAVIDSPVLGLTFTTTHLDHQMEDIRVEQARALNDFFEKNQSALGILAGDFNATPQSETMSIVLKDWTDFAGPEGVPTIPAGKPSKRIDYILVRPRDRWKVVRSEVLNEPVASDHRPVLSVLMPVNREKSR